MNKFYASAASCALAIALLSPAAHAQASDAQTAPVQDAQSRTNPAQSDSGEIVVTAQKGGAQSLQEVPLAIQAFSGEELKERNITVLLCGMRAAPNLGPDYIARFEAIFPDLAKKYDALLYPFFLDGVATQTNLALRDGLLPNAGGVVVIVTGIMPKVEELIARLQRKDRS